MLKNEKLCYSALNWVNLGLIFVNALLQIQNQLACPRIKMV